MDMFYLQLQLRCCIYMKNRKRRQVEENKRQKTAGRKKWNEKVSLSGSDVPNSKK